MNHCKLYKEWFMNMPDNERKLYAEALRLDGIYFADMRFEGNSIVKPYVEYLIESTSNGMEKQCHSISYEMTSIQANNYRFQIAPLDDGTQAMVYGRERRVVFDPKYARDKATILHELIHVHVNMLNRGPAFYREILLLLLYNKLRRKMNGLDSRIPAHTHAIPGESITMQGGEHGILFYLKSLELDRRRRWKPGTICGYGRDE